MTASISPPQPLSINNNNKYKHYETKVYYSRDFQLYETETESKDIEYLNYIGPVKFKNLILQDESFYLSEIMTCSNLFFRGNSQKTALEVLFALSLKIPIFSLETKNRISEAGTMHFVNILQKSKNYAKVLPKRSRDFFSHRFKTVQYRFNYLSYNESVELVQSILNNQMYHDEWIFFRKLVRGGIIDGQ